MRPKIPKVTAPFVLRECDRCGSNLGANSYIKTRSFFYSDGYLPTCNDCIKQYLVSQDFSWKAVDKLCQYADLPFVPVEFERLHEDNGDDVFPLYAVIFEDKIYEGLGWDDYFKEFKRLERLSSIEDELPRIKEEKWRQLADKWGANYDQEALNYLERLYEGLLMTQNISGALQGDQALKICKISYELDNRIRDGADFDKMLTAYDRLVKTAEFTPKNVKNASDFDSMGELVRWLEKRGWKNTFYDGATRDIVDETIKNIQAGNRRLYVNETGIGEEITRRIEALQSAKELERETSYYGIGEEFDIDEYENEGYEDLFGESEEFMAEVNEDD